MWNPDAALSIFLFQGAQEAAKAACKTVAPSAALMGLPSIVSVFAAIKSESVFRVHFATTSGFASPFARGPYLSGWSNSAYSLRKNRNVLNVGFGAVWPSPQSEALRMEWPISLSF